MLAFYFFNTWTNVTAVIYIALTLLRVLKNSTAMRVTLLRNRFADANQSSFKGSESALTVGVQHVTFVSNPQRSRFACIYILFFVFLVLVLIWVLTTPGQIRLGHFRRSCLDLRPCRKLWIKRVHAIRTDNQVLRKCIPFGQSLLTDFIIACSYICTPPPPPPCPTLKPKCMLL